MATHDFATIYRQTTAVGASPVGQVVALYDTILRDLFAANAAMEAGEIEKRVNAVNHALTVIGELQGVLDFDKGAEPARNLNNFYIVARGMLVEAGITSSRGKLKELIAMFTRLRAAWSQVEGTVQVSNPAREHRISAAVKTGFSQDGGGAAGTPALPSKGRWRA